MRMTYASFMQFLWKCWHEHVMKHFVTMAGWKGCHGNDNGNGATATFRWSDNSLSDRCKQRCGWHMQKKVGWSWISGSHGMAAWQRATIRARCKHTVHLRQHAFVHGSSSWRLYLWSMHFRSGSGSVRCRGSSRSRVVVGSSCSRGDGSGSSRSRDGSGSSGTRRRR